MPPPDFLRAPLLGFRAPPPGFWVYVPGACLLVPGVFFVLTGRFSGIRAYRGKAKMTKLSEELTKADSCTLHEIIRLAESHLNAQLTTALAADQRAMSFASVVAAGAVVVASGAIAVLESETQLHHVSWVGFLVTAGLLTSMYLAISSARPSRFWFTGSSPSDWINDIQQGKPLHQSLAEQADHYAGMIDEIDEIMRVNGKRMIWSIWTCWTSLVIGGLLAALVTCVVFSQ